MFSTYLSRDLFKLRLIFARINGPNGSPNKASLNFYLLLLHVRLGKYILYAIPVFHFIGNWSGIRAVITIKRKMGYFLVHVYSPSALIVVLSWISFCIPLESTAARVTLGITSVLTTTTILNILNNSMPKVIYVMLKIRKVILGIFYVVHKLHDFSLH